MRGLELGSLTPRLISSLLRPVWRLNSRGMTVTYSTMEFHGDGYGVPEREEIASEGKKVDATPCTPIFDTGESLAKDLYQRGTCSRKDILSALKLANLKSRINYRTIQVSGQAVPKKLATWVFGLHNRGGVVGVTNDTKRN